MNTPPSPNARLIVQLGAIWLVFIAATCAAGWSLPAWDLSASYIAGRLAATGQVDHIYDQSAHNTMADPHSPWAIAAVSGGITDGVVTPYIQTPLYAWLVSPIAGAIGFATFRHIFLILAAAATACLVFAAARHWAPPLARPPWQAGLLAGLFFSVPNEVAVALGQTHIYFMLLAVLAIIAAQRDRAFAAGALLALAAAVKISPGWVALAWLAAGYWRAAGSFAITSAGLLLLAWLQIGGPGLAAYAHGLSHTGSVADLGFNNDSLAAVMMAAWLDQQTAFHDVKPAMPVWVALASAAALFVACVGAGLLDRVRLARAPGDRVQVGPVVALVAATAFTPLAWNHYFIVLVVPVILFLGAARRHGLWGWAVAAAAVVVLDYPPLAYAVHASVWVVALRSEFWAALICVCALPFLPRWTLEHWAGEPGAGRAR